MFGFNSWSDFTSKAAESIQNASESAKTGLQQVSSKTKEFTASFPDNAKSSLTKLQSNVSTFVEEQRQQFQQVEHETELRKRRKERKAKLLKYGIPPWHIFDESTDVTPNPEEKDATNDTNNNNNNTNDSNNKNNTKKNCTYEELRLLILKLCEDENTFLVEAPSSESVFPFSMDTALPYANAALNYDPILPRIRYKLVPKKISEQQFWKNYFYRVQLIRESMGYPKLDLSANAPSMDLLKKKIANSSDSPQKTITETTTTANNNNSNNTNNTNNDSQSKSIFEQNNVNNNNNNLESETNKSNNNMSLLTDPSTIRQNISPNGKNSKNTSESSSSSSTNVTTNDNSESLINNNNNNNSSNNVTPNNNLIQSVVSLDSSESVTANTSHTHDSLVQVTKKIDSNNRLQSVSTETIESNDNNDNNVDDDVVDEDDEDYLASSDLHIDALSPEARARMQKELGLNGVKSPQKNVNTQNANNVNNAKSNADNIDDDDEDVDALLANVDVDGASDISDDELAKVMSEVENS